MALAAAAVDLVSGLRREVNERQLDALTREDRDRPWAVWSTVAERLSVVAGQVTANVVVFAIPRTAVVVCVVDELRLGKGCAVDRLNLTSCYNHTSNATLCYDQGQ